MNTFHHKLHLRRRLVLCGTLLQLSTRKQITVSYKILGIAKPIYTDAKVFVVILVFNH